MWSRQQFTPGKKSNAARVIYYAELSHLTKIPYPCVCIPDKYDKTSIGEDSPSIRISNAQRISQWVQNNRGGTTQYGNFYLGKPLQVNALGRMEGMPGGSGAPPRNL